MVSADRTSLLAKLISVNFLADTVGSDKGDIVYSSR
jgi:hypothetical protein